MLFTIHNFISDWEFEELFQALNSTEDVYIDIDSTGGNLRSAWKMYDAIRTHQGEVYVNVSGDCMSAAILPLLAAKPENRTANANAQFLIHKPLLDWWGLELTDEDCVKIHEEIQAETEKLKATYMERTNAKEDELNVMINAEQIFGIDLAINLGFINKKNEYINKANKNTMKKESKLENLVRMIAVKAGIINQKEYKTADDKTLIVETDGEPKVGDETPSSDGVYMLPDGRKISVADGVITAIEEGSANEDAEGTVENEGDKEKDGECKNEEGSDDGEKKSEDDETKKELENLRTQISELQNKNNELAEKASSYDRISALINKCGGEKAILALSNVKSKPAETKSKGNENETTEDDEYERFRKL